MPRPRFSEMLVERRRQLGLSITQASKILRLKEQALIAFEEGDFKNMPQSGYAQGMLSSYARYLGLNPREIVDLFQEESYEFENGTYSHELRRRTRDTQSGRGIAGYDVVNELVVGQRHTCSTTVFSPHREDQLAIWAPLQLPLVFAPGKPVCLWVLRHLRRMLVATRILVMPQVMRTTPVLKRLLVRRLWQAVRAVAFSASV